MRGLNVEAMEGDVLDTASLFKAFQGVRGVFHLAGIISIMPGENPFVRKVNVEGTRNVMQIAKANAREEVGVHEFDPCHSTNGRWHD